MDNKEIFSKLLNDFEAVCPKKEGVGQCILVARRAYKHAYPDYKHSHRFKQFIENKSKMLPKLPFSTLREVVDELKAHKTPNFMKHNESDKLTDGTFQHNGPSTSQSDRPSSCSSLNMTSDVKNQENLKKMTHLNKLNKILKKLSKKIQKFDEMEVGSGDDEDSAYIKSSRYKQRFNKVYAKICEIKGDSNEAGRLALTKIEFTGTKYPAINSAISRFCNANVEFPDFRDIVQTVETFNENAEKNLTPMKVHQIAVSAFKNLLDELRKHRRCDYYELINYYMDDDDEDPAEVDMELMKKLEENEKRAKKEEEVLAEFANRQDAEEKAAGDKKIPDQDDSTGEEDDDDDDEEESGENNKEPDNVSDCDDMSLSSSSSSSSSTINEDDSDENDDINDVSGTVDAESNVINEEKSNNESSITREISNFDDNKFSRKSGKRKISSSSDTDEDDRNAKREIKSVPCLTTGIYEQNNNHEEYKNRAVVDKLTDQKRMRTNSNDDRSANEIIDANNDVVSKRKSTNDFSLKDNNSGAFVNKLRKKKRIKKSSPSSHSNENNRTDVDKFSLEIKNDAASDELRKIESIPENNSSLDKRDEISSNRSVSFGNDCTTEHRSNVGQIAALLLDDPDVTKSDAEKNVGDGKTRSDVTDETSGTVTGDFEEKVTAPSIKKEIRDKRNDDDNDNRFSLKNGDERNLRSDNGRRNNRLGGNEIVNLEKLKEKYHLKDFNITVPYFKHLTVVNGETTVRNDLNVSSKNNPSESLNKTICPTDDVADSYRKSTPTTGCAVTLANENNSNKTVRRNIEVVEVSSGDEDSKRSAVTAAKPNKVIINVFSKREQNARFFNPRLPNNVIASRAQFNQATSAAINNSQYNRYQRNQFPPNTTISSTFNHQFNLPNNHNNTNRNYQRGPFPQNGSIRSSASHLPSTSAQFTKRTTTTTRCEVTSQQCNDSIVYNETVVSTRVVQRVMQHVSTSRIGHTSSTANVCSSSTNRTAANINPCTRGTTNQLHPGTKLNSNGRSVNPECILID